MRKKFYEKFLEVSFICKNSSHIGFWKVPVSSLDFKILKLEILTSVHFPIFLLGHTPDSFLGAFSY